MQQQLFWIRLNCTTNEMSATFQLYTALLFRLLLHTHLYVVVHVVLQGLCILFEFLVYDDLCWRTKCIQSVSWQLDRSFYIRSFTIVLIKWLTGKQCLSHRWLRASLHCRNLFRSLLPRLRHFLNFVHYTD